MGINQTETPYRIYMPDGHDCPSFHSIVVAQSCADAWARWRAANRYYNGPGGEVVVIGEGIYEPPMEIAAIYHWEGE